MSRRRLIKEVLDEMGLRYAMGEFIGNGSGNIVIEHGLGEMPLLFAFIGNESGEETAGMFSGTFLNTGVATRYTTAISKNWADSGVYMVNDGTNVMVNALPSSNVYGVSSINENSITINAYASKQKFIDGKIYNWIAIADWR